MQQKILSKQKIRDKIGDDNMDNTMKVLVSVQSAMEAAAKAQAANLNLNPFPQKIEHFTVEDFVNALFQLDSATLQEISDWYQSDTNKCKRVHTNKKGRYTIYFLFAKRNDKMTVIFMGNGFYNDPFSEEEDINFELIKESKAGYHYFSVPFMKEVLDNILYQKMMGMQNIDTVLELFE